MKFQILQMWNEQGVAGAIIELGKKMLNIETAPDSAGTMTTMQAAAAMATATLGGPPPSKTTKKKPGATKKPKGGGGKGLGKLEKEAAAFTADAQNEELKALEAYILKLSQQGKHSTESVPFFLLILKANRRMIKRINLSRNCQVQTDEVSCLRLLKPNCTQNHVITYTKTNFHIISVDLYLQL